MATVFSMSDPNPGAWFKFDEDDPKSGEIRIRSLTLSKRKEIQKKTIKHRVEYKHGQRFEYDDANDDLFSELLWDYTIAEWKGLEDDKGKPIQCTKENKLFLMQNNVGFAQFVSRCMEKISEEAEERAALVEKN